MSVLRWSFNGDSLQGMIIRTIGRRRAVWKSGIARLDGAGWTRQLVEVETVRQSG